MNKTEFKKLMNIQGGFSEKAKEYVKEICKLIFTINRGV